MLGPVTKSNVFLYKSCPYLGLHCILALLCLLLPSKSMQYHLRAQTNRQQLISFVFVARTKVVKMASNWNIIFGVLSILIIVAVVDGKWCKSYCLLDIHFWNGSHANSPMVKYRQSSVKNTS